MPLWRALRVVSGARRRAEVGRAWRRRSSAATASCARSRISSTPAPTRARRNSCRYRDRRDRQVAAGVGVLQVLRRARRRRLLAPRPLPGLRRGRDATGRSRTWCGCAAGSPRTRSRRRRSRKLERSLEEHSSIRRSAGSSSRVSAQLLGLEERRARARGPVRRLAAVLRAARRRLSGRAGVRGHAVGRRGAARFRRVPARVVAQLAALSWSRSPGRSCSTAARPGARASAISRRSTSSRCRERGDGGAARRAGAGPARTSCASSPRARRGRAAVRGRDGADAARPRRCSCRRARSTGRPGRSRTLEVPETLQALIAARLDGLSRRSGGCVQDAAVLGKTFTRAGAGGAQRPRTERRTPLLAGLVRKEVLGPAGRPALARARPVRLPAGPRPPRRVRDALQARAASAATSRRPSTSRRPWPEEEVAEVVASHLLEAYRLDPDGTDAETLLRRGPGRRCCSAGSALRRSAPLPKLSATSNRPPN